MHKKNVVSPWNAFRRYHILNSMGLGDDYRMHWKKMRLLHAVCHEACYRYKLGINSSGLMNTGPLFRSRLWLVEVDIGAVVLACGIEEVPETEVCRPFRRVFPRQVLAVDLVRWNREVGIANWRFCVATCP